MRFLAYFRSLAAKFLHRSQIENDLDRMNLYRVKVVFRDLLADGEKVRHDPRKLAHAIFDVWLSDKMKQTIQGSSILDGVAEHS